jgi:hypothetical protein
MVLKERHKLKLYHSLFYLNVVLLFLAGLVLCAQSLIATAPFPEANLYRLSVLFCVAAFTVVMGFTIGVIGCSMRNLFLFCIFCLGAILAALAHEVYFTHQKLDPVITLLVLIPCALTCLIRKKLSVGMDKR